MVVVVLVLCALLVVFAIVAIWLGVEVNKLGHSEGTQFNSTQSLVLNGSILGKYRFASVASDNGRCSEIGTEILARKGGSAVDAAIATMLCNGVLNYHNTGIGGGSFMLVYNRNNKTAETIDFRESAPLAAFETMYSANSTMSIYGGLAVAVPSQIKGYWKAHQKYGRVPWKDLVLPSVKLCRTGFKVGKSLSNAIKRQEKFILNDITLRDLLINSTTGKILQKGDTVFRPKLAKTLETLANEGMSAFYNGSLSQDIVNEIQHKGGIITLDDLLAYEVKFKQPLVADIDGMKVYACPPPSGGVIAQLILNILDGYNFTQTSLSGENASLTYHRIVESFKFAYAKRSTLGDEGVGMDAIIRNLTSKGYIEHLRSQIWDNMTHDYTYYGSTFYERMTEGTSHVSVVASNGDAVAITSTINTLPLETIAAEDGIETVQKENPLFNISFGSKVRGNKTGIIYNNEMDDFSSPGFSNAFGIMPSQANFIKPGKRPMSSMSPMIIVDNKDDVKLVIGASGGSRIISATAYVTLRNLWFGESINEAIDAKRLHHQLLPDVLQYEPEFSQTLISELEKKGHKVARSNKVGRSAVQGIRMDEENMYASSDHRKGGYPDGY